MRDGHSVSYLQIVGVEKFYFAMRKLVASPQSTAGRKRTVDFSAAETM
jgi:hypothetical protein